jgi:hypothetical protein
MTSLPALAARRPSPEGFSSVGVDTTVVLASTSGATRLSGATATRLSGATAAGETVGAASEWTFGTMALWGFAALVVAYLLYRRFG